MSNHLSTGLSSSYRVLRTAKPARLITIHIFINNPTLYQYHTASFAHQESGEYFV